jgi:hypothetical protein
MIRLYAFSSKFSSALTSPDDFYGQNIIANTMRLGYMYDQSEFNRLTQSPLSHDIFINKIGHDLSGKFIKLADGFKVDDHQDVIHIKNSELPKVLSLFDKLNSVSSKAGPNTVDVVDFIVDFLRLSLSKGYDVVSTSELGWKFGD